MICSVSKRTCKRTCLSLSLARALSLSLQRVEAHLSRARARALSLCSVSKRTRRESAVVMATKWKSTINRPNDSKGMLGSVMTGKGNRKEREERAGGERKGSSAGK